MVWVVEGEQQQQEEGEEEEVQRAQINSAITNIIKINTKSLKEDLERIKEELEQSNAIIKAKDDEIEELNTIQNDTQQQLNVIKASRDYHMGESSKALIENQSVCCPAFAIHTNSGIT